MCIDANGDINTKIGNATAGSNKLYLHVVMALDNFASHGRHNINSKLHRKG